MLIAVVDSDCQLVYDSTFRLNIFTCFHTEVKVQCAIWEQTSRDSDIHNMLLVKLFCSNLTSKIHIDALRFCFTVPSDSILVTINRLTHTVGVHLTKINLSAHDIQNDPVFRCPIINLVQVELDVDKINIHHIRTRCLGDGNVNAHVVATRSQQSQKVREIGFVEV